MRALIIDDSKANRMVLEKYLRQLGFATITAESGMDAVWMLKQDTQFDVITVDQEMPKMTGLQFIRLIRERPELNTAKIIMITGKGSDSVQEEAAEIGTDGFLPKPFALPQIAELLQALGLDTSAATGPVDDAAAGTPLATASAMEEAKSA
jgi:two-component system chemotaxis response regulator CheY